MQLVIIWEAHLSIEEAVADKFGGTYTPRLYSSARYYIVTVSVALILIQSEPGSMRIKELQIINNKKRGHYE